MFDFSKGDPLANFRLQNLIDMHKEAGAKLNFNGATGAQEMGVVNHFMAGSQKRVDQAL